MRKRNEQLIFSKVGGWGGNRAGAGRPNLSKTVNHMKRPTINGKMPLHITQKLSPGFPSLRTKTLLKEFNKAAREAKKFGFYVLHFSLLKNHLHMVVEAKNNKALGAGMRSLGCRMAKSIKNNANIKKDADIEKISDVKKIPDIKNISSVRNSPDDAKIKRNKVFHGRYHLHVLRTPAETKNALKYVLLNHSQHWNSIDHIDAYSSGHKFEHWPKLLGRRFAGLIQVEADSNRKLGQINLKTYLDGISPAQSWLARSGWMRVKQIL